MTEREEQDCADFPGGKAANAASLSGKPLGIYIHIPFCARKCAYCDFLSAPATEETMRLYADSLKREMREAAEILRQEYVVSTVFFGGGTPSILPESVLSGILEELFCLMPVKTDAEITVECNPGTLTAEKLGRNHVYFLPYLMGERSPINDTNARGTFVGMTMDTTRSDLVQAVLEGVAFAIRDSFEVARSLGLDIPSSKLCGGGSKSPLWRTIFANVLGIPLELPKTEQGPGYGGAMLAMVGCGRFESVQAAADALVEVASVVEPDSELTARYEARYRQYRTIYPALKPVFAQLL